MASPETRGCLLHCQVRHKTGVTHPGPLNTEGRARLTPRVFPPPLPPAIKEARRQAEAGCHSATPTWPRLPEPSAYLLPFCYFPEVGGRNPSHSKGLAAASDPLGSGTVAIRCLPLGSGLWSSGVSRTWNSSGGWEAGVPVSSSKSFCQSGMEGIFIDSVVRITVAGLEAERGEEGPVPPGRGGGSRAWLPLFWAATHTVFNN